MYYQLNCIYGQLLAYSALILAFWSRVKQRIMKCLAYIETGLEW
jgi:hypothetical protein